MLIVMAGEQNKDRYFFSPKMSTCQSYGSFNKQILVCHPKRKGKKKNLTKDIIYMSSAL